MRLTLLGSLGRRAAFTHNQISSSSSNNVFRTLLNTHRCSPCGRVDKEFQTQGCGLHLAYQGDVLIRVDDERQRRASLEERRKRGFLLGFEREETWEYRVVRDELLRRGYVPLARETGQSGRFGSFKKKQDSLARVSARSSSTS